MVVLMGKITIIGVVTSTNLPYPELTEAMKLSNERIYKVASGQIELFKQEIINTPPDTLLR